MKGRLCRVAFSVSGFSNQFLEARSGGAREVGGENPVKVARDIACDVCTKEWPPAARPHKKKGRVVCRF